MTVIKFESRIAKVGTHQIEPDPRMIEIEPMFFASDKRFALKHGGPLTFHFINALPDDWIADNIVIDSRSHMLMEGWYPAIPGWHLDDVPRTREDGQPDHVDPEYHAEHIMCLVGNASLTQFAIGDVSLVDPPLHEKIYGVWTKDIDRAIDESKLTTYTACSNELIKFNWQTWHRAMPTHKDGWRWFIRATRYSKRPVINKLRTQVQVYLPAVDAGW